MVGIEELYLQRLEGNGDGLSALGSALVIENWNFLQTVSLWIRPSGNEFETFVSESSSAIELIRGIIGTNELDIDPESAGFAFKVKVTMGANADGGITKYSGLGYPRLSLGKLSVQHIPREVHVDLVGEVRNFQKVIPRKRSRDHVVAYIDA